MSIKEQFVTRNEVYTVIIYLVDIFVWEVGKDESVFQVVWGVWEVYGGVSEEGQYGWGWKEKLW